MVVQSKCSPISAASLMSIAFPAWVASYIWKQNLGLILTILAWSLFISFLPVMVLGGFLTGILLFIAGRIIKFFR